MRLLNRGLWVLGLLISVPVMSLAQPLSDEQLDLFLATLSKSLHETSFEALITYEHSGYLDNLLWRHVLIDGEELSSIERLNGPSVINKQRLGDGCLSLADKMLRGDFLPFGETSVFSQSYRVLLLGEDRVASRDVQAYQVLPRDDYRFGYHLDVDKASGLPLRLLTLGSDNRVLERYQVVKLELLPPDVLADSPDVVADDCQERVSGNPVQRSPWVLNWVPSGFVLSRIAKDSEAGSMMVYQDGLSTVSVFVRPGRILQTDSGRAQRGATLVYMEQLIFDGEPFLVTVVGEVPVKTAIRMAASVRPAQK